MAKASYTKNPTKQRLACMHIHIWIPCWFCLFWINHNSLKELHYEIKKSFSIKNINLTFNPKITSNWKTYFKNQYVAYLVFLCMMYVITPKTDDFTVLCDVVLTTQLSSMSKIVFYDINLMPRNLILISDRHQHYTFRGIKITVTFLIDPPQFCV